MKKVSWDFSKPATLGHLVTGSGGFDGTTEVGRARASLGTSNAVTRVAAPFLGTHGNDFTYELREGRASTRLDQTTFRVTAPAGTTAANVVVQINARADRDPRTTLERGYGDQESVALRTGRIFGSANVHPWMDIFADLGAGNGSSNATEGSATFSGGVDPTYGYNNFAEYTVTGSNNAGLFVFDHHEPLVLVQMAAYFNSSVAWALTLRKLGPTRVDLGTPIAVASATGTSALVLDRPVVIPPGWGLGLTASELGGCYITVQRAPLGRVGSV